MDNAMDDTGARIVNETLQEIRGVARGYESNKVILLNGPPGCGKDTLASALAKAHPGVFIREFKTQLYVLADALFGLAPMTTQVINMDRERKEVPMDIYEGRSCRQALIFVSEKVIKPNFGEAYFGEAAANRLQPREISVFSDSGFSEEAPCIIDKVGIGNVMLLRIEGRGSYAADSRNFLPTEMFKHWGQVHNIITEEQFHKSCLKMIKPFLAGVL